MKLEQNKAIVRAGDQLRRLVGQLAQRKREAPRHRAALHRDRREAGAGVRKVR